MAAHGAFDYHGDRGGDGQASARGQDGADAHVVDDFEGADRALVDQPPHPGVGFERARHPGDAEVGGVQAQGGPGRAPEGQLLALADLEALVAEPDREGAGRSCHNRQGTAGGDRETRAGGAEDEHRVRPGRASARFAYPGDP